MNLLANTLARIVRAKIDQTAVDDASEIRFIFHGPPLEILADTFELLVAGAQPGGVPVLLQVPSLDAGEGNPAVGSSGRCDETHLLNLRNSPSRPTYVALIPPGQHSNRSVATTTDEFGIMSSNKLGTSRLKSGGQTSSSRSSSGSASPVPVYRTETERGPGRWSSTRPPQPMKWTRSARNARAPGAYYLACTMPSQRTTASRRASG